MTTGDQHKRLNGSISTDKVYSFSAKTSLGTVINLYARGSLVLGGHITPILLAVEFIPGTDNREGTITLEGLPTLVHLPLGQGFITPATGQQIHAASKNQ